MRLESVDLDSLGVETKALLLIHEKFLNVLSLVSLELNDLTHFGIVHDSTIAGKLLFDNLEDLLLVKFLRETLDGGQGLTSISLLDSYMNVILRLLSFSGVFVGLGEGIVGLEIFDGHKLGGLGVSLGNGYCRWMQDGTATRR